MPTAILDQTTKHIIRLREPEYKERTRELSDHLKMLKAKQIIEDQVFYSHFGQGAYESRQAYRLAPECLRDEIIEANKEASDKFHEAYNNDLLEEVIGGK